MQPIHIPEDYQVSTVNKEGLESEHTQAISWEAWNEKQNSDWINLSDSNFLTTGKDLEIRRLKVGS
jgi:hypothetical protein